MELAEGSMKAEWEKQKLVALYIEVEEDGKALLPFVIPEVTRVVDTITGRTALVHKIFPKVGVQVWVKERGNERENWSWSHITVRQPRRLKRYPRPFRWPREVPTKQCHCKIGLMELIDVEKKEVICLRCKNFVGNESYPKRIERAENLIRKASIEKSKRIQLPKRIRQPINRKTLRRSPVKKHIKKRKTNKGRVFVRPKRRVNAKRSVAKKVTKRATLPKSVSGTKNSKVSKVQQKVGKKTGTSKRKKVKR